MGAKAIVGAAPTILWSGGAAGGGTVYSPGLGALPMYIKVTSDGTTPIIGANVRISGLQSAAAVTDATGTAAFTLSSGAVTVSASAAGYFYTPTTHTVINTILWENGQNPLVITMTLNPVITPSGSPATTNVFFTCRHADLSLAVGVVFKFTLIDPKATTDGWGVLTQITATSDSNGVVQVLLAVNSEWRMAGPGGVILDFTTSGNTTTPLPLQYVGDF